MNTTFRQRLLRVILLFFGGILLLIGYLLFWRLTGIGFACPFYDLTKLPCPGCGITRSLFSLLTGNIALALQYHPLIFFIIGYGLWYLGVITYHYLRGDHLILDVKPYWVHIAFLGLFLGFGAIRILITCM